MNDTNAVYYDGRVAERFAVVVHLEPDILVIRGIGGEALARWPYATLRIVDQPQRGHAGMLTSELQDAARLVIADPELFRAAELQIPAQVRSADRRRTLTIVAGSTAALAALVGALWLGWSTVMDLAVLAIPRSWDAAIGRSVVLQLAPREKTCAAPEGAQALDRLADRLADAAGRPAEFDIRVVEDPAVNAFAAPGGFIVIHSALIDRAGSADEVAGVLAHEMAHVIERHSMRLVARHYGLNLLVQAFTGQSRLIESLTLFQLFAYGREFEAQADARALELLNQAGLRADGMAAFFRRLDTGGALDSGILRYLSTHPPTGERRALAERAGSAGAHAMAEAEWTALRAICSKKE